jgi:hypothetical protein
VAISEHKGIEYQVVQTASPTGWKWTVQLSEGRVKTGVTFSKGRAIFCAINAIELHQHKKAMAGNPPQPDRDLDAEADAALDVARSMSPGSDKVEALKKAGLMRNAADASGIAFAKRGRPKLTN